MGRPPKQKKGTRETRVSRDPGGLCGVTMCKGGRDGCGTGVGRYGPGGSPKMSWVAPGGRAVAWGRGLNPLLRGFGSEPGAGPPFGEGQPT